MASGSVSSLAVSPPVVVQDYFITPGLPTCSQLVLQLLEYPFCTLAPGVALSSPGQQSLLCVVS